MHIYRRCRRSGSGITAGSRVNVEPLSVNDLAVTDLSVYDAIITGVRAYNVSDRLISAQPLLLQYVQQGGTLLVQYNTTNNFTLGRNADGASMGPYPFSLTRGGPQMKMPVLNFFCLIIRSGIHQTRSQQTILKDGSRNRVCIMQMPLQIIIRHHLVLQIPAKKRYAERS